MNKNRIGWKKNIKIKDEVDLWDTFPDIVATIEGEVLFNVRIFKNSWSVYLSLYSDCDRDCVWIYRDSGFPVYLPDTLACLWCCWTFFFGKETYSIIRSYPILSSYRLQIVFFVKNAIIKYKGGPFMKLDMHCHVKEGSIDSKVSLDEYITKLKQEGFDGMLITDHDTYKGYRHWKYNMKGKVHEDFVVLKGIEYDTRDAGHIICIMPEGVKMRLLELRGMKVTTLIDFVHRHGGILGPAHPCGEKYMSFAQTKRYYVSPEIMKRFDFVETFNACEPTSSNEGARKLAEKYKKPGIGGSDSHKIECVGKAYTILPEWVSCETELISLIRKKVPIEAGGTLYDKTTKERIGKASKLLAYSFWFYNKGGALLKKRKRIVKSELENPIDPIDPIEVEYLQRKARTKMNQ